jgi:hypothetical protein
MGSYSSLYGCGGSEALHVCHDCPGSFEREFARVRLSGFVKKNYYATLKASPLDLAVWQAGVDAGNIIILPETSGNYDPGEPKELKGFGSRRVTYGPRNMKLLINDPVYYENYHFYNEIIDRTDLIPFFGTSSLLHLFDETASIKAKDPVADDLEEEVIWNVECEVISKNIPAKYPLATIESLFVCGDF